MFKTSTNVFLNVFIYLKWMYIHKQAIDNGLKLDFVWEGPSPE